VDDDRTADGVSDVRPSSRTCLRGTEEHQVPVCIADHRAEGQTGRSDYEVGRTDGAFCFTVSKTLFTSLQNLTICLCFYARLVGSAFLIDK
jgi:hypothetical protein